jgi:hypothetical protein
MTTRAATPVFLVVAACTPATQVEVETIAPRPDDVATVDGMIRAFYAAVNVAPDGPRLWARDRTLYAPWLRFVAIGASGREIWTHQQLVDETEPMVRAGFREHEVHRRTRVYGNIAHVDSVYEAVIGREEPLQRVRGVNSIELYFDGRRWWIASVMWQSETADHPIPAELLP